MEQLDLLDLRVQLVPQAIQVILEQLDLQEPMEPPDPKAIQVIREPPDPLGQLALVEIA
jgi:hypothetical protein